MDTVSQSGEQKQGGTRYPEMQDRLDKAIYHPIAAVLAHALAKTPVTPNMVSITGGLAVALAGAIYVGMDWPIAAALGLLVHMSWHVFDGADGDLARLTGKSSPQGEIVDGICDYLGHIILYSILAGSLFSELGWTIWALAIGAGISRIFQANFYESQRRQYLSWVYGVPWLKTKQEDSAKSGFHHLGHAYLWVSERLIPTDPAFESALSDPGRAATLRSRLRALGPKALSGSALLGANYRTLALGLSMFAGSSVWYFLYEIVILNAFLVIASMKARGNLQVLRGSA